MSLYKNILKRLSIKNTILKAKQEGFKGWLKLLLRSVGYLLLLLAFLFVWFSKDLPTPGRLKSRKVAEATQIFDRKGEPLFTVAQDERRISLTKDEIPSNIKNATVAIEDHNFYHHPGVDFRGIARSVLANITSGGFSEGGSTITQQFVKNALLDPRKTITRKIKEVILSLELEAIYSKDEILTMYLNEIPYGSTAYGVEAASQFYFGKHAKDLNLSESAALVALPQAPTYYSPYGEHKADLLKRKDRVLTKMVEEDYLSDADAQLAKKQEVAFVAPKDSIVAPHFVFWVKQQLVEKYGEEIVNKGGLKVTTTLDLETQKKAVSAIEEGSKKLDKYGANNAALVSVDPKTGEVLAMVGSKDYFNNDIQGQVNVTVRNRQPGSSFKPYVYVTAFANPTYNPAYTLFDLKTDFGGGYTPDNYTGQTYGPVSMRQALANSLNISAVKTLGLVGVDKVLDTVDKLGIKFNNDPHRCGLALVLGCAEVSPLEMASAFGSFINNGVHADVVGILKVESSDGKTLEEFQKPTERQALDPSASYLIADVMSDNDARAMVFGTRNFLTIPNQKVGAKTGTTSEFKDAWTVGYSPYLSTAVWIGNTDNTAMKKGADGSVVAAPIWQKYMTDFHKGKDAKWIDMPSGVKKVTVDKYSNRLPTTDSPEGEHITDLFASWHTSVKEKDNVHARVKVNKVNGKLATDQTPLDLVEERTFVNVRSEKPDNSNWEGPVRAWAQANGLTSNPPTEKDDLYSLDKQPVVSILEPANGATVTGQFNVVIQGNGAYGTKKLALAVDGKLTNEANDTTKATFSLSSSNLTDGEHKLTAFATDGNGVTANVEINITYKTLSLELSGLTAITTLNTATISWQTNINATDQVEYGLTDSLGSSSTIKSTKSQAHQVVLSALLPLTTYYYQAISTDESGKTIRSALSTFVTK